MPAAAQQIIGGNLQHIGKGDKRGEGRFTITFLIMLVCTQRDVHSIRKGLLLHISLYAYFPKALAKFHVLPSTIH